MSSNRHGNHPARPFGTTGGGFAEGQNHPEDVEPDPTVGGFASGQDDQEEFPEDVKLGQLRQGPAGRVAHTRGHFCKRGDEAQE